jgi:hypothetical protein
MHNFRARAVSLKFFKKQELLIYGGNGLLQHLTVAGPGSRLQLLHQPFA